MSSYQTGATYIGINLKDLRNLPIPIPSFKEQIRIVSQVEEMRRKTQRLETIYQRKIEALQELKQAILQKAFAGELTNPTVNKEAA